MKELTPKEAYEWLADACGRAEYCTHELREKLRRRGVRGAAAEEIVGRLAAERYVDDARYARALVRQKAELSRWGRRKIACALAAKRIDRAVTREALEGVAEEVYAASVRHVLAAKVRQLGDEALTTYEGRTRLFRYAAGRGFLTAEIGAAIREMMGK